MNSPTFSHRFALCARIIALFGTGILLTPTLQAQPTASRVDSRFLLVFDTSAAMKVRVPATQYAVERLFFSMMNGQLRSGDTIGVWTFGRKLRLGELPLQSWLPQNAAVIASNITNCVRLQHYSRSTRFDVLMPEVNDLVQKSERLTVLIFCDGNEVIKGTPYDNAINSTFKQNESALKKAGETFIVVLRAQFGQYIGYTVNSSAIGVNFPDFPPLPQPPQPIAPAKTNPPPPPPPAPVVTAPPLVIVGTNVVSNLLPPIPARSVLSNSTPVQLEPNPPPAEARPTPTNASPTNATPSKMAETQTNAQALSGENSGLSRNGALAIGAVLLAVAVVVIIVALVRSRRRGRGSLITRSMK
ncbi:MAG TPA: hypothetical protein VG077_12945 [Verrucomicrobiae bacterium]|nr:hypothetical protein [Verrucomicrobiae bacterium]